MNFQQLLDKFPLEKQSKTKIDYLKKNDLDNISIISVDNIEPNTKLILDMQVLKAYQTDITTNQLFSITKNINTNDMLNILLLKQDTSIDTKKTNSINTIMPGNINLNCKVNNLISNMKELSSNDKYQYIQNLNKIIDELNTNVFLKTNIDSSKEKLSYVEHNLEHISINFYDETDSNLVNYKQLLKERQQNKKQNIQQWNQNVKILRYLNQNINLLMNEKNKHKQKG